MAKVAQEKLTELEKADAPINEQLEQAGQFAGIEWLDFLQTAIPTPDAQQQPASNFHGREEWVLRWLLKKLQSADARRSPQAWRLFRCLVERIPLPNAARLLKERRFLVVLRQAIEEAVAARTKADESAKSPVPDSSDSLKENSKKHKSKSSKKRKRSGELVTEEVSNAETYDIAETIYEALDCVVRLTKHTEDIEGQERGKAFAAEYMKSVLRTTPEESAKVLGSWLAVCGSTENRGDESQRASWLTPVIEIWNSRMDSADDSLLFSKYCLQPLLKLLLSAEILPQWRSELEQLLSRSIILPAKIAHTSSKATDILASFVNDSIAANPEFAPIIFDDAIRSLQPSNTHRSRQQDANWLQAVFCVAKDAIPEEPWKVKNQAITKMLEMCLEHKISVDLELLRSITSQCGFHGDETDSHIIATILKLNGQVFTIASADKDLLQELFSRITNLSTKPEWLNLADVYVDEIIVPLMGDFAKARDLTGFIHRWYDQLVEFNALVDDRPNDKMNFLCPWEDDALVAKLKEVMEASLTPEQTKTISEWLREKADGPAVVIADAVTGALTRAEFVDAIGLNLFELARSLHNTLSLTRYDHRRWRVLTHVLDISTEEQFKTMWSGLILFPPPVEKLNFWQSLSHLEVLKCAASIYTNVHGTAEAKAVGIGMEKEISKFVIPLAMQWFKDEHLESEIPHGRAMALHLQTPTLLAAYTKTFLVDYPKAMEVFAPGPDVKDSVLHSLMWLASTTTPYSSKCSPNPWIRANHSLLPGFWKAMLKNDDVLNDQKLIQKIIDILIQNGTHHDNPIEKWTSCNGFAIECLNSLPIEVFSRNTRERILKAWPPAAPEPSLNDTRALAYRMSTLDAAVISLKMKMMEKPSFYEGLNYHQLWILGEALSETCPEPKAPLDAFAEYTKRILGHAVATIGQAKTNAFIIDMINGLSLHRTGEHSKSILGCGLILLNEVVFSWWSSNVERIRKVFKDEIVQKFLTEEQKLLREVAEDRHFSDARESFKTSYITNLRRLLQKPAKLKKENDFRSMSLYSTIRALEKPVFEVQPGSLAHLYNDAVLCAKDIEERIPGLASQIRTLFIAHVPEASDAPQYNILDEEVTTSAGRMSIKKKIEAQMKGMDDEKKREALGALLPQSLEHLDKLLAVRYILESCEDLPHAATTTSDSDLPPNISSIYLTLTDHLLHAPSLQHFYLLTELLSSTLRTKPRALTQHTIETTLTTLTTLLTPSSPSLPSPASPSIYLHLTTLLDSLLSSHRLKLSGRTHLLNLPLLALLRPLFTPLSTHTSPHPPWLSPSHPLSAPHAAAFARLLTTLADPSASAVARTSSNPLVSATAKAKRVAGAHLPVILGAYVKMSLDPGRRMEGAVREKVKQGLWAVLETMGAEGRKVLGEEMDRPGRDVLRGLVEEWARFGRWKGN